MEVRLTDCPQAACRQSHIVHSTVAALSYCDTGLSRPLVHRGGFDPFDLGRFPRRVVLFFTGHAHAGQNLQALLAKRAQELGPPLQMCDALAANVSGELATVVCNCLAHGRRRVIDVLEHFPEQALHIIEQLAQVYGHDAHCREHAFTDARRLAYHQINSTPVMTGLHDWMTQRLALREAEPNSGLGDAIGYLIKHWQALTRFLYCEGAPLDNTACERALERAIVDRKNSLFFKTNKGAQVATSTSA